MTQEYKDLTIGLFWGSELASLKRSCLNIILNGEEDKKGIPERENGTSEGMGRWKPSRDYAAYGEFHVVQD